MSYEVDVKDGAVIEAEQKQNLLELLLENGVEWMHPCNSQGVCGLCVAKIEDGGQNLSEMSEKEENTLERIGKEIDGSWRLACRTKVKGNIQISKPDL